MQAINRAKILLTGFLLVLAIMFCGAAALFAGAAEYGWTDTDFYYYEGGYIATTSTGNSDYAVGGGQRRGLAVKQGITSGEISFTLRFPNGALSDIFFFGLHNQRLTGGMTSNNPPYHIFRIGAGGGASMTHFGKSGGVDYTSSIDSTVLGTAVRNKTVKVRLLLSADGSMSVYFDIEGSNDPLEIAVFDKIYADKEGQPLYFHMAFHVRNSSFSTRISDLQIKDGSGKIVFRDDFTLLKQDLDNGTTENYLYDTSWKTDMGTYYDLVPGTLKKHLTIQAPDLGILLTTETYDLGMNGDYAPAVSGTGSLTVTIRDPQGDIVQPQSGTTYAFTAAGEYTAEYVYADTEDPANTVQASAKFTVSAPYLILPVIAEELAPSESAVDLTPYAQNLNPGETLSVSVTKRGASAQTITKDSENKYLFVFSEAGYYTVSYSVSDGTGQVYSDELEVTVRPAYTESYLTVKKDAGPELTSQLAYVDMKFEGAVTVEIEASFGNAGEGVLNVGFFATNANTTFGSATAESVLRLGASKSGLGYVQGGTEKKTASIAELYDDGVSDATLFYSKTSFRLELGADGSLKVYAKLIEEEAFYLGDSRTYSELSADYVLLYTFDDWASAEFIEQGFYFGFGFATANLVDDVYIWRLSVANEDGAILFGDNFTDFALGSGASNGSYYIASSTLRNAIGTRLVRTEGSEWLFPYIDTSAVATVVYTGVEVDLTARLVNADTVACTVVVTDAAGETVQAGQDGKYSFDTQGRYTVRYTAGDVGKKIYLTVKNASDQPTVELDFSSAWKQERIESQNAAISEGELVLNGSPEEEAYFITKGNSEIFILTVKFVAAEGEPSIVFGKTEEGRYSFTLTEDGVVFTDYEGVTTLFESDRDFYGALSEGKYVVCRAEVMSGTANFSAVIEGEPDELIESPVATVGSVAFVGQVGISCGANMTADDFRFVNLTSVPNDNTVTEVPPEEKDEDKEDNEGENDPDDGNGLPVGAIVGIVIAAVVVVGGGIVAAVIMIRKNKSSK